MVRFTNNTFKFDYKNYLLDYVIDVGRYFERD